MDVSVVAPFAVALLSIVYSFIEATQRRQKTDDIDRLFVEQSIELNDLRGDILERDKTIELLKEEIQKAALIIQENSRQVVDLKDTLVQHTMIHSALIRETDRKEAVIKSQSEKTESLHKQLSELEARYDAAIKDKLAFENASNRIIETLVQSIKDTFGKAIVVKEDEPESAAPDAGEVSST